MNPVLPGCFEGQVRSSVAGEVLVDMPSSSLLAGLATWRQAPDPGPAPDAGHAARLPALWRDAAWAALVGRVDAVLRRRQGVIEFTDGPACVLRVERCRAPFDVTLSDGARVRAGEPVAGVHFWNEHLPRFSAGGPDLRWAKTMQGRMAVSLGLLADFIEQAPEWRDVRALRGCAPFYSRLCVMRISRVTARYGFDVVEDAALGRPWHAFGENVMLWALARAFNPAATARQPFRREKHELWISRERLLERYGHRPDGQRPPAGSP